MDSVRSVSRNVFSKKQLYKKVPILDWLPKYDVQTGVSDLIAGITVGLTVIPQGIAYALIAKLPPQVIIVPYPFNVTVNSPKARLKDWALVQTVAFFLEINVLV